MSATITPSGNNLLVVLYLTGVPEDPHAIPFYQFQVVSLTTWAVTLPCIDVWDSTGGYSAPVYTVRRVPLAMLLYISIWERSLLLPWRALLQSPWQMRTSNLP